MQPDVADEPGAGCHLGRKIEDDYQIGRHEISATPRATARLAQHREEVLKLVDLARHEGKRISQDTWHFVYRTAPQYSNEPKPAIVSRFLQILPNPLRLGELLRRLHEMGVLEKIIPEFSHARSLLQFNQYHKYTVDEHCIRAVDEVTRFAEREDVLGEVYRGLADKTMLHLALLLHDLGKGFEEDHSEGGSAHCEGDGASDSRCRRADRDARVSGAPALADVAPGVEVRHDADSSWSAGLWMKSARRARLDMLYRGDVRRPGGGRAGRAQQLESGGAVGTVLARPRGSWRRGGSAVVEDRSASERRACSDVACAGGAERPVV